MFYAFQKDIKTAKNSWWTCKSGKYPFPERRQRGRV